MPRRPEIGTVQLYPNRPLRSADKNGYVLKFYCPLRAQAVKTLRSGLASPEHTAFVRKLQAREKA